MMSGITTITLHSLNQVKSIPLNLLKLKSNELINLAVQLDGDEITHNAAVSSGPSKL